MKKKILVKIIIGVILSLLIVFITNSLMPVMGNEVALGQLENDNTYFLAMQEWQNLQNRLSAVNICVWMVICMLIGIDIYEYIKKKNNNKGENI